MSPTAYRQAREENSKSDDNDLAGVVDERPYMPLLMADVDDMESIRRVTEQILAHPTNSDITITSSAPVVKVSGGATNRLFRVGTSILVRIFGAEGMIDRDEENTLYAALARQGIAPAYYGRFGNGRLEAFLNARPLEVREMPTYATDIARELARIHREFERPEFLQSATSSLWTQLWEWWQQASAATFTGALLERYQGLRLSVIREEIEWLQKTQVSPDAPVVFCHNDLLSANILVSEGGSIQLIDFEYGGVNYRTFDLANHFNEYAGGPPHDTKPHYEWMPTKASQRQFVESYLGVYNDVVTDQEIEETMAELHAFLMVNHIYWGLWAAIQAATEGCDEYDYMEYSMQRIAQYWVVKEGGSS